MPKRVNIRISESLDEWFKRESEDMGIPKSAMMAMALQQFAIQYQSISSIKSITDLVEEEKKDKMMKDGGNDR